MMVTTNPEYSLNVAQMHASLQSELETSQPFASKCDGVGGRAPEEMLRTLSLGLEEVAHIRSVLTRAELEGLPLDGNVRDSVERGKVKFPMKTSCFVRPRHNKTFFLRCASSA